MTSQEQDVLKRLELRVRQLILQDAKLQQQQEALRQQLAERENELDVLRQQLQESEKKYSDLRMARVLELNDNDTRDTRRRLLQLTHEVDKCIAILKA